MKGIDPFCHPESRAVHTLREGDPMRGERDGNGFGNGVFHEAIAQIAMENKPEEPRLAMPHSARLSIPDYPIAGFS